MQNVSCILAKKKETIARSADDIWDHVCKVPAYVTGIHLQLLEESSKEYMPLTPQPCACIVPPLLHPLAFGRIYYDMPKASPKDQVHTWPCLHLISCIVLYLYPR